jgi:hypothetical protein
MRTELPKFLDLQVKDTYTWNSITEHYYQYLVDYNGKIPEDLDENIGKIKKIM